VTFSRILAADFTFAFGEACSHRCHQMTRVPFMSVDSPSTETRPASVTRVVHVRIARWINERCPPLDDILSAHNVARLTRRPPWLLTALCVVGRFPRRLRFRGRRIGWCRLEVLEWMAHQRTIDEAAQGSGRLHHRCSRRHPRHVCVPFECAPRGVGVRKCSARRLDRRLP
jgi:hypothetical protein